MDLSVAIVNWNTREMLRECLDALLQHLIGLDYEVIVVDNGSTDGSVEMVVECYPNVHVIQNIENQGFARANNQAIRDSTGRYILLLNSDAFIQDDSIKNMVAILDANPQIGIAGARLVYPDGSFQVSHSPLPSLNAERLSLLGLDRLLRKRQPINSDTGFIETGTVEGACLIARREALDQFGLMDEDFFFFSEEVDLCYRAHKNGWKVVNIPETRVVHVAGGSTGIVPRRILLLYRGKLQYYEKHFGREAREKLYHAMVFSTRLKVLAYRAVRIASLGHIRKDSLWREVSKGLAEFREQ